MNSSAEGRVHRRVLRENEGRALPMASVVSPRGTFVMRTEEAVASPEPDVDELLVAERRAGFAEGRAAALSDAALELELARAASVTSMAASLSAACANVARDRRAVVDEVVSEAVDLVFELIEVLLGDELAHRDAPVRSAVARALAMAPDGEDVRVRVHPGTELTPAELEVLVSVGSVSVIADPAIEPNGCVVDAGACRIDAQIGPALERVHAVLEQLRSPRHESVLK
ncbi:MAG: fliH [Acidimicrobiaceae bacterium]|nr:fliH [Acidimicrobiaceae bacterium]